MLNAKRVNAKKVNAKTVNAKTANAKEKYYAPKTEEWTICMCRVIELF